MDCLTLNLSCNTSNGTGGGGEEDKHDTGVMVDGEYWPLPLIIGFILAGIFGNCLVCLAISTNRELQNMTNYFLMSLAVADLLVSTVVMPFGALVIFKGGVWPMSEGWCVFYQTCDVLACSVSILHLMFISIGRYRGITKPLVQRQESEKAVLGRVVLTWGLGMILASPIPVLGVIDMDHVMIAPDRCELKNRQFKLLGSLFSFYIPMVIMVTTYILTVHQLSKQKLQSFAGSRHVVTRHTTSSYTYTISSSESVHRCCRLMSSRGTQTPGNIRREILLSRSLQPPCGDQIELTSLTDSNSSGCSRSGERFTNGRAGQSVAQNGSHEQHPPRNRPIGLLVHRLSRGNIHSTRANGVGSTSLASTVNEEKASRVLGIVFTTFILCWTPFFLLNLITCICEDCVPPFWLGDTALWSGYVSSTINPLIYTVFNAKFRRCFARLVLCKSRNQTQHSHAIAF